MFVKITEWVDRPMLSLSAVCTGLFGLYLALFQSGIVSYAGAEIGVTWLSRMSFLIYGATAICAAVAIMRGSVERRLLFPLGAFIAIAAIPLVLTRGEIGPVTKSYLIALGSIGAFTVAAMTTDLRRIAQFSASALCVVSVCCVLDACFFDGFSNTAGRAAFLYINPNIAGIALLLGAAATAWSIPLRWIPVFLILVGGAVFATLSRGAILMGVVTICVSAIVWAPNYRSVLGELRSGINYSVAAAAFMVGLFAFAMGNNHAFSVAISQGFRGAQTAVKWTEAGNAEQKAQTVFAQMPIASTAKPAGIKNPSATATMPAGRTAAIAAVEEQNSASARALLAERAWHQAISGPAMGIGLERAFAMAPHNSYLLFAMAFGYAGWLVIPALIGAILYLGKRRAVPAAMIIGMSAMVSHDLLFAMPLVSSLALILPSVAWKDHGEGAQSNSAPATLAAIAVLIAALCILTDASEAGNLPSYEKEFSGADIKKLRGLEYYAELPALSPPGIFRLGAESREYFGGGGISVSEGGIDLPSSNRAAPEIAAAGHGRYGFHNMWVLLSSSDGTDPSSNGRVYRVRAEVTLHPLFLLSVLAAFLWAAIYSICAFDFLGFRSRIKRRSLLAAIADA
jgi:hypothetical protein